MATGIGVKTCRYFLDQCVGGIVVSIAAFQAVDPGSIPGRRKCLVFFPKIILGNPSIPRAWNCRYPFCTIFRSVGPPSPASKIWHPLEFVPVKPCPDCLGSSWDPSTERPERQLHSSTAMFATKQARRPSLHETISHLCFLSEACLYPRTSLMMLAGGLMQGKLAPKTLEKRSVLSGFELMHSFTKE